MRKYLTWNYKYGLRPTGLSAFGLRGELSQEFLMNWCSPAVRRK